MRARPIKYKMSRYRATHREAEVGGLLEPMSSLGSIGRLSQNKAKQNNKSLKK